MTTFYDSQQVQGLEQNIHKQLTAKGYFAKYRFHDIVDSGTVPGRSRKRRDGLARKQETEEIAKAKLAFSQERDSVRKAIPFTSWQGFIIRRQ